jgi:hypothetical protein
MYDKCCTALAVISLHFKLGNLSYCGPGTKDQLFLSVVSPYHGQLGQRRVTDGTPERPGGPLLEVRRQKGELGIR